LTGPELCAHVDAHATGSIEVTDLTSTHAMLSLDGPYAWELFAEVEGPEVIGQPYMSFFHAERFTAFRIGKTGEYGYYLLTPREQVDELRGQLLDRGARFDVVVADLEALDQCALENWFFNIRREGQADVSPVELQLQWRVSYKKSFVGSDGLAERRRAATRRIVQCVADTALAVGAEVAHRDQTIGTILNAGFSPTRGDWVGMALVDRAYSHPGIDAYTVRDGDRAIAIRTIAAPAVNNRSLYINPQIHSYQTRREVMYPPLVLAVR
jgi:aminomethyltransferase